jgi:hypothetical protein
MDNNKRSDLHDHSSRVRCQRSIESQQRTRIIEYGNNDISSSYEALDMLHKDVIVDCRMERRDITVEQLNGEPRDGEHNPATKFILLSILHDVVIFLIKHAKEF